MQLELGCQKPLSLLRLRTALQIQTSKVTRLVGGVGGVGAVGEVGGLGVQHDTICCYQGHVCWGCAWNQDEASASRLTCWAESR